MIIEPVTTTAASVRQPMNDNSYLNSKQQVPQSTANAQTTGKRFTFTINPREPAQKASRPTNLMGNTLKSQKATANAVQVVPTQSQPPQPLQ